MAFCTWWFSSLAFPVGALAELHSEARNKTNLPDLAWVLPFSETVSQQVVKAGYIPSLDITVASVYIFITTIFIYKHVHESALPRLLCSAALWSN